MNGMTLSRSLCLAALVTTLGLTATHAQTDPVTAFNAADVRLPDGSRKPYMWPTKTFYLTNITGVNDANEITTALRNLLGPGSKIYLVPSQNAVVVSYTQDQIDLAAKLIAELDRPHKSYRLEYTITEVDGGKRLGTQHYSMTAVPGQRMTLKQGTKIPVATGSVGLGASADAKSATQTQFTYLDIGMNFANTVTDLGNGSAMLTFKVEQSSVAPTTSALGVQDPIVRQAVIEDTAFLTLGKPLILGSLDIPDTTRHLDIEAMLSPIN